MRNDSYANNPPKIVLVNRALIKNKDKILIVRRSSEDIFCPKMWELPGGKLEGGQDIATTLAREIYEETGLSIEVSQDPVYWHSHLVQEGRYRGFTYVVIIAKATYKGEKVRISEEHSDFKWVTIEEALDYDLVVESRKAIKYLVMGSDKISNND